MGTNTRAQLVITVGITVILASLFLPRAEGFQTANVCTGLSVNNLSGVLGTYVIKGHQPERDIWRSVPLNVDQLAAGEIIAYYQGPYANLSEADNQVYRRYGNMYKLYVHMNTKEGCAIGQLIQNLVQKYNRVTLAFRGVQDDTYFQVVITQTSSNITLFGDPFNYLYVYNPNPFSSTTIYQGYTEPIDGSILQLVYSVEGANEPPRDAILVPATGVDTTVPVVTAPAPAPSPSPTTTTTTTTTPTTTTTTPTTQTITPTTTTTTTPTKTTTTETKTSTPWYTTTPAIIAYAVTGAAIAGVIFTKFPSSAPPKTPGNAQQGRR